MYGKLVVEQNNLSRRERERQMRRHAMLEAAQTVFAEKGYANATVDEIAQRAEFGKGTLYNYFEGGKEDILFAIFDGIYDDLCRLIRGTFDPEKTAKHPIRDLFNDFIESCFSFFLARHDLFMILIKEAHRMSFSDDQEKAAYFIQQHERVVNALVPPLEAAMARGELRPHPPHAVASMILGNINGCQMQLLMERRHEEADEPPSVTAQKAAAFVTTMLFDGLLVHPSPPASTN